MWRKKKGNSYFLGNTASSTEEVTMTGSEEMNYRLKNCIYLFRCKHVCVCAACVSG